MALDKIDFKVLRCLSDRGRITWSDLAGELGISSPAAAERVRKLEEAGVIQGYAARLDAIALGYELTAFIGVTLALPSHIPAFLAKIAQLPAVQECHHMAGDDDYLLKVRCRHTRELEQLISQEIKGIAGVVKTRSTIALSTCKETLALPLPEPAA